MAGYVVRSSCSLVFLLLSVMSVAQAAPEPPKQRHKVADLDVDVVGDLRGFAVKLAAKPLEPNLDLITITVQSPTAQRPPAFALKWAVPSHDVAGQWTP
jgi:hypothetical protein